MLAFLFLSQLLFYILELLGNRLLTANDDFYKFWDAIVKMKVNNNNKFLTLNDISFVDRNNLVQASGLKSIYIRKCYKQLATLIRDQDVDNAVITGTPGVGKTMFRNYMVYDIINHYHSQQVKQDFTIVLDKCPGRGEKQVFKGSFDQNSKMLWNAYKYSHDYFDSNNGDTNLWYLVDVSKGNSNDLVAVNGRTIMFTSPSEAAYSEFVKEKCLKYYMPTWKYEEAIKMNEKLKIDVNTLNERWGRYGGIARALFTTNTQIEQYYKDKIENAINKLVAEEHFEQIGTANETKEIRHSLLYFEVIPKTDFRDAKLNWGTLYIKSLVGDKYVTQLERDLNNILDSLGKCVSGSLKGLLLEPLALKLLSNANGTFVCERLNESKNGLNLAENLHIGPLTVHSDISDGDFGGVLVEYRAVNKENVMLIPSSAQFPAIDAVAIVTVDNTRHYYMLQVTINKDHSVTGLKAITMVQNIVEIAGGVTNCAFIYVLPKNNIFTNFKEQTMPKYKNQIVPQYKIALQQQVDNNEPNAKKQKTSNSNIYTNNNNSSSSSSTMNTRSNMKNKY